jgi:hypothetical protein
MAICFQIDSHKPTPQKPQRDDYNATSWQNMTTAKTITDVGKISYDDEIERDSQSNEFPLFRQKDKYVKMKPRTRKIIFVVFISALCLRILYPVSVRMHHSPQLLGFTDFIINDPLAYAIETEHPPEVVHQVLNKYKAVYTPDHLNACHVVRVPELDLVLEYTYLELVVSKKQVDVVRMLLEAGCNPNYHSPSITHALRIAIDHEDCAMVRTLMEYGATLGEMDSVARYRDDLRHKAAHEKALFVNPPMIEIVSTMLELESSVGEREFLCELLAMLRTDAESEDSKRQQQ